jgi:hypothetical protein
MKRSQLCRMIFDRLKPEMPELVMCNDLICVTPLNSVLRGVVVTILTRSPKIAHVSAFARLVLQSECSNG